MTEENTNNIESSQKFRPIIRNPSYFYQSQSYDFNEDKDLACEQKQSQENTDDFEDEKIFQLLNKEIIQQEFDNPFLKIDEKIQNAMVALMKPIQQRNQRDKKSIALILESSKFMKKTIADNKKILHQMTNCIEVETVKKGQQIFQYGDEADKFYLIVKGKVSVLVPKTQNELALIKQEIQTENIQNGQDNSPLQRTANHTHRNSQYFLNFPEMMIMQVKSSQQNQSYSVDNLFDIAKQQNTSINMDEQLLDTSIKSIHTKKKSNFLYESSQQYISLGRRTSQRCFTESNTKNTLSQAKNQKRLRYQQDERIISEVPLLCSEVINWKQYFLVENNFLIVKYNHIKFLCDGDDFGDVGLLLRKPRSATILATQDTILLTMQKQDFKDLIQEISFVNTIQIIIHHHMAIKAQLYKVIPFTTFYTFYQNIILYQSYLIRK